MIRRLKYTFLGAAIVLTGTVVAQQATRFLNVRVLEDLEVDQTATLNALSVQTGPVTLPAASIPDSALSSNVPLKNAVNNVFTGQRQTFQNARPSLYFVETDASADSGRWEFAASSDQFVLNTFNDEGQFAATPFRLQRSGTAVTLARFDVAELEVNADDLDFNGNADISGTLSWGGGNTISSSNNVPLKDATNVFNATQTISSSSAAVLNLFGSGGDMRVSFLHLGAPENQGRYSWVVQSDGTLSLQTAQDSGSLTGAEAALRVLRSAQEVTEVELNADALDFNGNADVSGNLSWGGGSSIGSSDSVVTTLSRSDFDIPNVFRFVTDDVGFVDFRIADSGEAHPNVASAGGLLLALSGPGFSNSGLTIGRAVGGGDDDENISLLPHLGSVFGSPTGGPRGDGSLNAEALYADSLNINGNADISGTLSWGGGSAISSSNNVALLDASNLFSTREPITGTHATDTRIRRGDTTGLLRLLGGVDASGSTGGHIALYGADVEGARANGADLNAGTFGVARVQAPAGTVELNANTIDINGNADVSGNLSWGGGDPIASSDNVALLDATNVFDTGGTEPRIGIQRDDTLYTFNIDGGGALRIVRQSGEGVDTVRVDAGFRSGSLTVDGAASIGGAATFSNNVTVSGTISGNGSGLSSLNASTLSSGTIPSARLPATIAGDKTFSGNVTVGGTITGNGMLRVGTNAQIFAESGLVSGSDTVIRNTQGTTWYEIRGLDGNSGNAGLLVRASANSGDNWTDILRATPAEIQLDADVLDFNGNVDISGNLVVNGTCTGCGNGSSDVRLKENIEEIDDALNKVLRLNGYTFNIIGQERRQAGVIAQEIIEVLPEVVHTNDDGYMSVAYGNITALLIEAIKDQNEIIEQQRDRIDALERIVLELRELNASVTFSADASF